jgi:hypothetical protein
MGDFPEAAGRPAQADKKAMAAMQAQRRSLFMPRP